MEIFEDGEFGFRLTKFGLQGVGVTYSMMNDEERTDLIGILLAGAEWPHGLRPIMAAMLHQHVQDFVDRVDLESIPVTE